MPKPKQVVTTITSRLPNRATVRAFLGGRLDQQIASLNKYDEEGNVMDTTIADQAMKHFLHFIPGRNRQKPARKASQ